VVPARAQASVEITTAQRTISSVPPLRADASARAVAAQGGFSVGLQAACTQGLYAAADGTPCRACPTGGVCAGGLVLLCASCATAQEPKPAPPTAPVLTETEVWQLRALEAERRALDQAHAVKAHELGRPRGRGERVGRRGGGGGDTYSAAGGRAEHDARAAARAQRDPRDARPRARVGVHCASARGRKAKRRGGRDELLARARGERAAIALARARGAGGIVHGRVRRVHRVRGDAKARWWLWGALLAATALVGGLLTFRDALYDGGAHGVPGPHGQRR
jgi:hypothetical protein